MVKYITPFSLEWVLEEKKLLCLEAWEDYLFAGLSDGALLLLTNKAVQGGAAQWAVTDVVRGFGSRRVLQLAAVHSKSMLLSLSDEGVSAHTLPSLRLKAQALRTRGAHLFSWDSSSDTLCVVVKKKLLVFKYDGLEMVEQREVSLPDSVHSMQLAGSMLYVGLRQEYVAVDTATGVLSQLFASRAPHTSCTAVPPAALGAAAAVAGGGGRQQCAAPAPVPQVEGSYMGGSSPDSSTSGGGPGDLSAAAAAAMAAPHAGAAGVLLTRDAQSVLMGADGRLSRRGPGVAWSGVPRLVAVSGPFAVASLEPPVPPAPGAASADAAAVAGSGAARAGAGGATLEVRLLEPLSASELVQRLALDDATSAGPVAEGEAGPAAAAAAALAAAATLTGGHYPVVDVAAPSLAPDGSLFVSCKASGAIVRLVPKPNRQQAAEMLRLEEYEEALYLCALMPLEQAAERRVLEDEIHLRYGQQLFGRGQYDEALAHFGQSALAGPLQLLALFPSLAPLGLLEAAAEAAGVPLPTSSVAEPEGEELSKAVSTVLPYLLSFRSRMAAGGSSPPAPAPQPQGNSGSAHAPHAAQQGSPSNGAAEEWEEPGQRSGDSGSVGQGLLSWEGVPGVNAAGGACTPLSTLLDTALLRALLALPDSGALLRYVQRPNCIDVEEGEAALREAGRYSELVALYQGKGRHGAALELLQTLSQLPSQLKVPPKGASAELKGLPGVWAAVRYLSSPGTRRDIDLITTHAQWILAADPDAGLEMFTQMQPPLPPSEVLPILTSYAPQLAGSYLEGALSSGTAKREEYEHELAVIYLLRVVGGQQAGGQGPGAEEALQQLPEYKKLKGLILCSQYVDCGGLLRVLPTSRLLELRAVLLERMGRHLEALRIYVHQLHALPLAEAYCDRIYWARQSCKLGEELGMRQQGSTGSVHSFASAGSRDLRTPWDPQDGGGGKPAFDGIGDLSQPSLQPSSGAVWGERRGAWGQLAPWHAVGGGEGAAGAAGEEAAGEDGDFDIYLLLIQVILEEPVPGTGEYRMVERAPDDSRWVEVARLLSRKRDAISPLRALGLLPGTLPLPSALPFLEGALWGAGEARRGAALARSLRRGEHLGLLWELVQARQESILMTPERGCSLCYKRIGTSAFVAFPSGLLAHYSCYRRSSSAAAEAGAGG